MGAIIGMLIFGGAMAVGFYIGVLAVKTDKNFDDYTDPIIDQINSSNAREERRSEIKKKYGFDDSYDKYIA